MSPTEAAALAVAALLAGAINAIAGGGTLLTFPALLAFGMPAVQANATSTLALVIGTAGSSVAYRAHMAAIRRWLPPLGIASVFGGLLGAWLLTATPEKTFERMVPFLLLFATFLFMAQGLVKRWVFSGRHSHRAGAGMIFGQFAVAVYGGYFGAGIGILMLAAFGLMGLERIHEMNALKTVLAAAINVVAAGFFVVAGLVVWPQAVVMTIAATLGYFAGAHFAQKIPEAAVRALVTLIGLGITAALFARSFGRAPSPEIG